MLYKLLALSLIFSLLCFSNYCLADSIPAESAVASGQLPFESKEALLKIDYLQTQLSGNPAMGLVGVHYEENLLPIKNFYSGIGFYGAVSGNTGGYFALGIDNDYFLPLGKYLALNPGFYFGGGGARSAGFGGGMLLIPHLGLDINLPARSQIGFNYSYTIFPNGSVGNSSQFMLSFQHYTDNYDLPFDMGGYNLASMNNTLFNSNNYFIQPTISAYSPRNSTSLAGSQLTSTIVLPGARGGYWFQNGIYVFAGLSGAAAGGVNGYMDGFGGVGYKLSFYDWFGWLFEGSIGAGGGGNVNSGGGLLFNPAIGPEIAISQHWALNGMVGYLLAPEGSFQAVSYSAGLKYNFNSLTPVSNGLAYSELDLSHWRLNLYNQTVINPQRNNGSSGAVNQISFGVDQFLNDNFFINYNANFAYSGDNSGGIASGTLGPGVQLNLGHFHPYLAIPIGEIGGGGINAGDGLIIEPSLGTYFDLSQYISINIAGGLLQSFNGSLQAPFINAGVSYRFSKLGSN